MDLPREVPVMTLPNVILFPHAMLPLYVFEPRYRQMLAECLANNRMFCVAMQRPETSREIPSPVAGIGLVRACVTKKDGTSNLILQGIGRLRLVKTVRYKPYRICRTEAVESTRTKTVAVDALTTKLMELLGERLKQGFSPPVHFLKDSTSGETPPAGDTEVIKDGIEFLAKLNEPEQLADLVSCSLLANPIERQAILETADLENRLKFLIHFLMGEISRIKKSRKD